MQNKLKDNEIYVNIKMVKNKQGEYKKNPYFGKVWGTLKKDEANATALQVGKAGVWVLDIDTKDLTSLPQKLQKLLPKKPTVSTARGYHYYFKGKGFGQTSKIFENVDTRDGVGVAFTSYWGGDKRLSWERVGEVMTVPPKLMKFLRQAYGKSESRKDEAVEFNYVDGEPWKKFDDGEQHGMILRTMAKMINERKSYDEVVSRAMEYKANFLRDNRHEKFLMDGRLKWLKNEIADNKISGKSVKTQKVERSQKKKKDGKKLKGWEKVILGKGEFDKKASKKVDELKYISFFAKHHHTVAVGASGTMKTSIIMRDLVEELKHDKELRVFMYSFDASDLHNRAMWRKGVKEGVSDRFHIMHERTKDDLELFEEYVTENKCDLGNAVVVIDTFKKIVDGNVNDKAVVMKAMAMLKRLTKRGCTVLSIAHTNKDGVNASGVAEVEQDADALVRFDAVEDGAGTTVTITKGGRVRYAWNDVSYRVSSDGEHGYDNLLDNIVKLDKVVNLTKAKSKSSMEEKYEGDAMLIMDAIREGMVARVDLAPYLRMSDATLQRRLELFEGVYWRGVKGEDTVIKYSLIKVLG